LLSGLVQQGEGVAVEVRDELTQPGAGDLAAADRPGGGTRSGLGCAPCASVGPILGEERSRVTTDGADEVEGDPAQRGFQRVDDPGAEPAALPNWCAWRT